MSQHIAVVRASHYGETVNQIAADPAMLAIHADLTDLGRLYEVEANFHWMRVISDRYDALGGAVKNRHIGGPVEALIALRDRA